jgi:hypothetical protein
MEYLILPIFIDIFHKIKSIFYNNLSPLLHSKGAWEIFSCGINKPGTYGPASGCSKDMAIAKEHQPAVAE